MPERRTMIRKHRSDYDLFASVRLFRGGELTAAPVIDDDDDRSEKDCMWDRGD